MNKKKLIALIAVIVALLIALTAVLIINLNGDKLSDEQESKKQTTASVSSKDDKEDDKSESDDTSSKDDASSVTTVKRKPLRANGNYTPIVNGESGLVNNEYTYDIKVTTFNVGGFYHGVSNGMNGSPDYENAQWVPGNLREWLSDIARFDADIYALQEFCPVFYYDNTKNISIASKEVFTKVFKQLETYTGSTANGTQPMYMGIASTKTSPYTLTDITYGHLGAKNTATQRAYMKGYVNVNGVRIAVYSVHLGFSDPAATEDSIYELINLMNNEDYCIVMGDMNTNDIGKVMKKAGFNVANTDKFGNFQTYEYKETSYIDNIFTTANIDIQFVECEVDKAGGSDHWPLSAYLKINKEMGSTKNPNQFATDNDGFIDGWYKP